MRFTTSSKAAKDPRSDGLVGYDVCLTRTRSPVRSWVRATYIPTFLSSNAHPFAAYSTPHAAARNASHLPLLRVIPCVNAALTPHVPLLDCHLQRCRELVADTTRWPCCHNVTYCSSYRLCFMAVMVACCRKPPANAGCHSLLSGTHAAHRCSLTCTC